MNLHSRRTFLIGAGSGAATGAALLTAATPATAVRADAAPTAGHSPGEPVVAYVSDVTSGKVVVMRGDDEVVVHDEDLARRITKAVR